MAFHALVILQYLGSLQLLPRVILTQHYNFVQANKDYASEESYNVNINSFQTLFVSIHAYVLTFETVLRVRTKYLP